MEKQIWNLLKKNSYKISTDTRKKISGSIYFAIKGENFDGNLFTKQALKDGAIAVVTDNPKQKGKNIFIVKNVIQTLGNIANKYRKTFKIPIIVIGGSNGKTTSKELIHRVLETKYKVHSTQGNLNNHIGLPFSIISMPIKTEIGVFEIGANHELEHTNLLQIAEPTHVVVTNNGMDHLEGFGSPLKVRLANKEIYDWAKSNGLEVFVNKKHKDLIEDSKLNKRTQYPKEKLGFTTSPLLTVVFNKKTYKTQMVGDYNIENIELAVAIGKYFKIKTETALNAICEYKPLSNRSEYFVKNEVNYILDCYNSNPSSLKLSIKSFLKSSKKPRGLILGDMLELGSYSDREHSKIVDLVSKQKVDCAVYIGNNFKKALDKSSKKYIGKYNWFKTSEEAKIWFQKQDFKGYTFLLKGSNGMKVINILDM